MDRIEEAFRKIDRKRFVPPKYKVLAYSDQPLPIGHRQTISQPTTVQMMLGWLDPRPGHKVLDVGSGSGWTSALLGYIVQPYGQVYAVELVPEILEFGEENCRKAGITNVSFFLAGQTFGLRQHAPYDRILVSASADHVPDALRLQLRIGGKMVVPVHTDILELTKVTKNQWETKRHPGFVFVPLL